MRKYVVGFLFSEFYQDVVLIRKNRPEWQSGRLNGIGGMVEYGESPGHAMSREFFEEAGIFIPISHWTHVLTLRFHDVEIEFFACNSDSYFSSAHTNSDEEVVKIDTLRVKEMEPCLMIENIPALILLSIQRLIKGGGDQVA